MNIPLRPVTKRVPVKTILGISCLLVFSALAVASFHPQVSHAQATNCYKYPPDGGSTTLPAQPGEPGAICPKSNGDGTNTVNSTDASGNAVSAYNVKATPGDNGGAGGNCSLTGIFSGNLGFCIFNVIGYIIFSFFNGLLSIIGWLFNFVIEKTVFEYGSYIGGSAGVIAGWGVLRDVANIGLIFGFIFLGLVTILDIHSYEVKKTLPRLIIFAILLNFSLLATQVVIDSANIFAVAVYGQTSGCSSSGADQSQCGANVGISGMLMGSSGLGSIFKNQGQQDTSPGFLFYMGATICIVIFAVVLLAGAIMLITRAVALTFLMVLAPLGFAGFAIPPFEKYAKIWWEKLLTQSFFAPLYLILIFIGLKVGSTLSNSGSLANAFIQGGPGSTSIVNSNGDAIGEIVLFTLIVGFMVAALFISKQMGAIGANMGINLATKTLGNATAGAAGFVGRRTLGRASNWTSEKLNATKFGRSTIGQWAIKGANYGATRSYDARAYGSKIGDVDLGKAAGKGGYQHIVHEGEEARKKAAKALRNTTGEEGAITHVKAQIGTENAAHQQAVTELDAQRKIQRAPLDEEIARLSPLASAGDTNAVNQLNNLARQREQFDKDYTRELARLESDHKQRVADLQSTQKAIEQKPQTDYVHTLHEGPQVFNIPIVKPVVRAAYQLSAGPLADHHAAESIIKELGKDETQKLIDALQANTAAQKDHANDNHGGGGGHAPAPAAAAGGGQGGGHH